MTDTDMQALEEALDSFWSLATSMTADVPEVEYQARRQAIRDLFKQRIPIAEVRGMVKLAAGDRRVARAIMREHDYEVGDDD